MAYNQKLDLLADLLRQGLDANTGISFFDDLREQRQTRQAQKKESLLSLINAGTESAALGVPFSGALGQAGALSTALGLGPKMQNKALSGLTSLYGGTPKDLPEGTDLSGLYVPEPGEETVMAWDEDDFKNVTAWATTAISGPDGGAQPENYERGRQLVHDMAKMNFGDYYETVKDNIDTTFDVTWQTTTGQPPPTAGKAVQGGGMDMSGLGTAGAGLAAAIGLNQAARIPLIPGSGSLLQRAKGPVSKGLQALFNRGAVPTNAAGAAAAEAATGAAPGATTATWTNPYTTAANGAVRNAAGKVVGREAVKLGSKGLNTAAAAQSEGGFMNLLASNPGANPAKFLTGRAALAGGLGVGLAALAADKTWNMAADATTGAEEAEWDSYDATERQLETWAQQVEAGLMAPEEFERLATQALAVEDPDFWNSLGLGLFSSQNRFDDNQTDLLTNRYKTLAGALGL